MEGCGVVGLHGREGAGGAERRGHGGWGRRTFGGAEARRPATLPETSRMEM